MSAQAATQTPAAPPSPAPAATGTEATPRAEKTPAKEAKPPASLLGPTGDEAKKEDEQSAGGESKDGKPAAGELEIKLPEGVEVDAAALDAFKGIAKELGLTSESASKLVAWNAAQRAEAAKADTVAASTRSQVWLDEVSKDSEFGGEKLKASMADAQKAMRRFGDKELSEFLTHPEIGLANHPGIFKMLARIGRVTAEDKADTGSTQQAQQSEQDRLRAQYPNSPELFGAKP